MTDVEYRLILHDEFSKNILQAEEHTKSFGHSLKDVFETLGLLELAHMAFDFVKESITDFENFSKANAQLEASLKSTNYAAGENTEALAKQREELAKISLYSDTAITSMQSLLLTFTNIKGEVFEGASSAIADMAAKMGGDMQSTVIQVGKALQDPINGISALHRVGVNFSEGQKEVIKNLVETGHVADAQRLIIKELNTEFGGSAAAAAKAAPYSMIKKQIEELRVAVGGFLTEGISKIAPYIQEAIEHFKGLISEFKGAGFFDEMITYIKILINFIEPLFEHVYQGLKMIFHSVGEAFKNVAQFFEPLQRFLTWIQPVLGEMIDMIFSFANFVIKAFSVMIDVLHTVFVILDKLGIIWVIGKAFELVWSLIKLIGSGIYYIYEHSLKPIFDAIGWAYDKIKDLLGIKKTIGVEVTGMPGEHKNAIEGMEGMGGGKGIGEEMGSGGGLSPKSDKVTGQKSVTINVTISKMIGIDKFVSTTAKAGAESSADSVLKMLTGAVNQFSASIDM
jgi:hypothetical protein